MLNKFKKHQSQANEARAKKKKESEEADRKKKEKLAKAKAEEANIAEQSQSSKIVELTDEQAEKLQKEIDSEVRGIVYRNINIKYIFKRCVRYLTMETKSLTQWSFLVYGM